MQERDSGRSAAEGKIARDILIVDDTLANLQLLEDILSRAGYEVRLATDGVLALRSVQAKQPDLILLDIRMPGMDGYEVCRRLKTEEASGSIPIIFISMLEDELDKVKGFQAGGVDYMTKPFNPEEVLARVNTHLRLRDLTLRLEQKVRQRTEELAKTNQQLQQDIAERKRVEAALRESEAKYRCIVDTATEGIWALGPDGRINFVNARMAEMLGYQIKEEMIGQPVTAFLFEEDAQNHSEKMQARREGIAENFERRFRAKGGQAVWFHVSATPVFDEENHFIGAFAMHTDITERKRAEEELKRAKDAADSASRTKDRFIAALSHELRTPLTPALAALSALQAQEDLPKDELRAEIDMIRRNVEMEVKLIDDLLDVTKISTGAVELHPEVVDAHQLLQTALEICRTEIDSKHISVSLRLNAGQHYIRTDAARMRQVFWNLLKNAAQYTPEGGRITLRTNNTAGGLKIEVEDTGIGIRSEAMPKIFEAFERGDQKTASSRFGGLGLGLSIAKKVVEMHRGTLTAFSEGEGKGAKFTVELPFAAPPSQEPRLPRSSLPHGEYPLNILLVDDHADTLLTMSKLLRKCGYTVVTANCVQTAMERLAQERFDLLISDLGLPDGSGLDIMRNVKQLHIVPGIAVSGYGTEEDLRRSRDAGFREHLIKPVTIQDMHNAIRRITAKAA